ncbi:class I SAM-dependent methyltransferase [Microbacteriaceae bacterium VKM Ac-2855]|nr:class I SAM-dependent methyltransferase [Microbacteriaceae bacterium VKM Ac-2855]
MSHTHDDAPNAAETARPDGAAANTARPDTAAPDTAAPDTAAVWDDVYRGARKWSGRPNVLLVPVVGDAPAPSGGTALDLGCGEGGDAIWLAGNGWDVLGVDVSAIALERARAHAQQQSVSVRFERSDLDESFPGGAFDLVTASYLHSPVALERDRILRRAWQAVAPGGRLVILSHAGFPAGHAHAHQDLPNAARTLAQLRLPETAGWRASAEYTSRDGVLPDGTTGTRTDHVVVVERR